MAKALSIYPLHQSPFYKLKTKKKLSELLQIKERDLAMLAKDENYKEKVCEGRDVQEPKFVLKKVHKRVKELLARIETPGWLMSGQKGKSIVTNAELHRESNYLLNVDISGFYKHSTRERLYQTFLYEFKMNDDVANVLSRILTWKNIVPTGSPSSQLIAFWANKKTFDSINEIANERGLKFSVYVDDISFSSEQKPIPRDLPFLVNRRLQKVGLQLKKTKTTFFGAKTFKIVTGVGINKCHKLAIPNQKQKKIIDQLSARNEKNDPSTAKSIFGSIVSNRQVIPSFMNNAYLELKNEIYPNKNG